MPMRDPRLDFPRGDGRTPSPGPTMSDLSISDDSASNIKFSFRAGGEKTFYDRLKSAMVQRKWLLKGAPPVPNASELGNGSGEGSNGNTNRLVGIASLEKRGQELRRNNERLIGSSFEDLETLMTSAKEIVALAESFSVQSRDGTALDPEVQSLVEMSASALGLATTKDMLGSDALYISELSRNLAEFLMDDSKGVLKKAGGVMTLVDVWAIFNRIRNGVELVSPSDFKTAAQMWEKLKLPILLRQFKSGLLVVHSTDRTEDKVIASILAWLKEIRNHPPPEGAAWVWGMYGRGITISEAAARFGWSIGITTEELEMAEERGVICREQTLGGIVFWENHFIKIPVGQWQ
jgi:ESCRT-II complex subunit VPS36